MSIQISNINKRFDTFTALDNINLTIPDGELVSASWPFRLRKNDPASHHCRTRRGG
jgi:ABC-type arginine transport system ATPase subunit